MNAYSILGAATVCFLAIVYFIPSVVAYHRGHTSATGIMLLNIFLGWTVLGWIGALVWSASGKFDS